MLHLIVGFPIWNCLSSFYELNILKNKGANSSQLFLCRYWGAYYCFILAVLLHNDPQLNVNSFLPLSQAPRPPLSYSVGCS